MLSEQDCPPGQRILPAICSIPLAELPNRAFLKGYPKLIGTPETESYLNWSPASNDLVLYSGYAWYDAPIPREYNFLFDRSGPGIRVRVQVLHALANWRYPLDSIAHGWKTAYVARFPDGIPEELMQLEVFTNTMLQPLRFAFCMAQDKDEVFDYFKNADLNPDDIG